MTPLWTVLLAGLAWATAPAFAQERPPVRSGGTEPAAWIEVKEAGRPVQVTIEPYTVTVGDLRDRPIYGAEGDKVGEVERVLATADGKRMAVALEVGGFLGIGERVVIVPVAHLVMRGERLILRMTGDDIRALPSWEK